jgi:hypothetical protein
MMMPHWPIRAAIASKGILARLVKGEQNIFASSPVYSDFIRFFPTSTPICRE